MTEKEWESFVDFVEMANNFFGGLIVDEKHAAILNAVYLELKQRREDEEWLLERGMNVRVQVDETDEGNCFRVQKYRLLCPMPGWSDLGYGRTLHAAIEKARRR